MFFVLPISRGATYGLWRYTPLIKRLRIRRLNMTSLDPTTFGKAGCHLSSVGNSSY